MTQTQTQMINQIISQRFKSITDVTFLTDDEQAVLLAHLQEVLAVLSIRGRNLALQTLGEKHLRELREYIAK